MKGPWAPPFALAYLESRERQVLVGGRPELQHPLPQRTRGGKGGDKAQSIRWHIALKGTVAKAESCADLVLRIGVGALVLAIMRMTRQVCDMAHSIGSTSGLPGASQRQTSQYCASRIAKQSRGHHNAQRDAADRGAWASQRRPRGRRSQKEASRGQLNAEGHQRARRCPPAKVPLGMLTARQFICRRNPSDSRSPQQQSRTHVTRQPAGFVRMTELP